MDDEDRIAAPTTTAPTRTITATAARRRRRLRAARRWRRRATKISEAGSSNSRPEGRPLLPDERLLTPPPCRKRPECCL